MEVITRPEKRKREENIIEEEPPEKRARDSDESSSSDPDPDPDPEKNVIGLSLQIYDEVDDEHEYVHFIAVSAWNDFEYAALVDYTETGADGYRALRKLFEKNPRVAHCCAQQVEQGVDHWEGKLTPKEVELLEKTVVFCNIPRERGYRAFSRVKPVSIIDFLYIFESPFVK